MDKDVSTGHSTRDSSPPATDADHHGDYGDDGEYNSKHSDSYELPKDAHDEVSRCMMITSLWVYCIVLYHS